MSKKIVRTAEGLRNALFDEIDNIKSGNSDIKQANAVAKIAKTIVDVTKMELEYSKYEDLQPLGNQPLKLGSGGGRK